MRVDVAAKAAHAPSSQARPIAALDAQALGVHPAITVPGQTTASLPIYVPRAHDAQLCGILERLLHPGARPTMVTLVGRSSTGKSRALYEAVSWTLPEWSVLQPRNAARLVDILESGVPAHSVVWLDELQLYLDDRTYGPVIAGYLLELLQNDELQPFAVGATIWPENLAGLMASRGSGPGQRGDQADAAAIITLVKGLQLVRVPDDFAEVEEATLAHAASQDDRLRLAWDSVGPGGGITQVLAGGVQLLHRLYPDDLDTRVAAAPAYTPAGRACITAALELRRIGYPNPLPAWAIEMSAEGELVGSDRVQTSGWLERTLVEASSDASTPGLVVKGVPALTPHRLGPGVGAPDAYEVHDFLVQDHLRRHRFRSTRAPMWDALVAHASMRDPVVVAEIGSTAAPRGMPSTANPSDFLPVVPRIGDNPHMTEPADADDERHGALLASGRIEPDTCHALSRAAQARGLLTLSLQFLRALEQAGGPTHAWLQLPGRLGGRINVVSLGIAATLRELAERGSEVALQELRDRRATGDHVATEYLVRYLGSRAAKGDGASLTELRSLADAGSGDARRLLAELLKASAGDGEAAAERELRIRAKRDRWDADRELNELLYERALAGEKAADAELRARAADEDGLRSARRKLADLLFDRASAGDLAAAVELRARASTSDLSAQHRYVELLCAQAGDGDEEAWAEIRRRIESGEYNRWWPVTMLLAEAGDEEARRKLRTSADSSDSHASQLLAQFLAARARSGDPNAFSELYARATGSGYTYPFERRLGELLLAGALAGDSHMESSLRSLSEDGATTVRRYLVDWLLVRARSGDQSALQELLSKASEWSAQEKLAVLLQEQAAMGSIGAADRLRLCAQEGDMYAQEQLAKMLENSGGAAARAELMHMTHAGWRGAAKSLLLVHQALSPTRPVMELDVAGNPVLGQALSGGGRP